LDGLTVGDADDDAPDEAPPVAVDVVDDAHPAMLTMTAVRASAARSEGMPSTLGVGVPEERKHEVSVW
jgi:hypothetical protein